jgi:hypothetical protein
VQDLIRLQVLTTDGVVPDNVACDGVKIGCDKVPECARPVPLRVYTIKSKDLLFQTFIDLAGSVDTRVEQVQVKDDCTSSSSSSSCSSSGHKKKHKKAKADDSSKSHRRRHHKTDEPKKRAPKHERVHRRAAH